MTAVTRRRDAVYPATLVGIPPQEDAYIAKATEKIFLAPIRLAVQPEVKELTMPVSVRRTIWPWCRSTDATGDKPIK